MPVGGFLPAKEFFASLSRRRFPTTVTIRSRDSIDYVPEPDIFHDVFGHVPLHSDPPFADFLQRFGEAATMARTPEEVEMMARLFWFTIEFGLINENGTPRTQAASQFDKVFIIKKIATSAPSSAGDHATTNDHPMNSG